MKPHVSVFHRKAGVSASLTASTSDGPTYLQQVHLPTASGGCVTDLFIGNALNGIDAKNRVSIPASFRDVITARSDVHTLILAPAERADCLIGYDQTYALKVRSNLEQRFAGNYSEERDDLVRATFGSAEKVAYDDNGRIILSSVLKDIAAIDRTVLFWGMGDYFEVWNPQCFVERPSLDARAVRVAQRLIDARGSS